MALRTKSQQVNKLQAISALKIVSELDRQRVLQGNGVARGEAIRHRMAVLMKIETIFHFDLSAVGDLVAAAEAEVMNLLIQAGIGRGRIDVMQVAVSEINIPGVTRYEIEEQESAESLTVGSAWRKILRNNVVLAIEEFSAQSESLAEMNIKIQIDNVREMRVVAELFRSAGVAQAHSALLAFAAPTDAETSSVRGDRAVRSDRAAENIA